MFDYFGMNLSLITYKQNESASAPNFEKHLFRNTYFRVPFTELSITDRKIVFMGLLKE